jgi:hypothetical protein
LVIPAILFVTALFVRKPAPAQIRERARRRAHRHLVRHASADRALGAAHPVAPCGLHPRQRRAAADDTNPELRYYTWRVLTEIPEHPWALLLGVATLASAGVLTMITSHLLRE